MPALKRPADFFATAANVFFPPILWKNNVLPAQKVAI